MKKKKHAGVERLKSRYGLMFVTPFIIGLILFFVFSLISSVQYMFSRIRFEPGNTVITWTGLKNI